MLEQHFVIKRYVPATLTETLINPSLTLGGWQYFRTGEPWQGSPDKASLYTRASQANNALEQIAEPGSVYAIEAVYLK
jgi:hypothetical protein